MRLPAPLALALLLLPGARMDAVERRKATSSPAAPVAPSSSPALRVERIGRYATGVFSNSGAEIPAFDARTGRLYVTNQALGRVDVIDLRQPAAPQPLPPIDVRRFGDGPTSVAVRDGLLAVAVPSAERTAPGSVLLFDAEARLLRRLTVGALPDMLTFSPDGRWLLVANEGEPAEYCSPSASSDPEGTVSVIDVSGDPAAIGPERVRSAHFRDLTRATLDPRIRVFGPGASLAQDLEPEAIAIAPDSRTAYVTLEEASALAVVDIPAARVTRLIGLGAKDHSRAGAGLDPSDKDGGIQVRPWPVQGLYQPDGIAALTAAGKLYLATANEGDARSYDCYDEAVRFAELPLAPGAPAALHAARAPEALGRLRVSRASGDADGDGRYEAAYAFGARSFALWSEDGALVFDSGDQFERILAAEQPGLFNADDDDNRSDSRSDDSGPEPEGIALGEVAGRHYAFVGLERASGVMVYDVTDPHRPSYVRYLSSRRPDGDPRGGSAGDLGPEGLLFIPASQAPGGRALLVVANEVSGSVTIWSLEPSS